MCEGVLLLFFMPFDFFCLECSRDVTSLLVDTGNGANLSFIIFVLLNSSQHLGVTLNVLTIKHSERILYLCSCTFCFFAEYCNV